MTDFTVLAGAAADDAVPEDTGALIDHILTRYHARHRVQLPVLIALAGRVEAAHAEHPDVPFGLAQLLTRMTWEMESHMQKEEDGLFPTLRSGHAMPIAIELMRDEHGDHATRLAELERLTRGHVPPADACGSWRALCSGTARLAADLREHIRLENDVLFPRFGA
jgi:regulator of cell morphogenesis and NO signaling